MPSPGLQMYVLTEYSYVKITTPRQEPPKATFMSNLVLPWFHEVACTDLTGRLVGQGTSGPRMDRGLELARPVLGWHRAGGGCCSVPEVLQCFGELGITRANRHTDTDHPPQRHLGVSEAKGSTSGGQSVAIC